MKRLDARRALAIGAGTVTVLLTAAAFWLSYEHLHDVASDNGLKDPARAWAWPGTVDLFIVAGELLLLRAALRNAVDWWAVALAGSGSLGSIALNVAGVGSGAQPLEYIVAAVPPVAALLAFGALMRQVHEALAPAAPVTTAEPEHDQPAVPVTGRYGDPVLLKRRSPDVVPGGVQLLPIVSATAVTPAPVEQPEVTIERLDPEPEPVVTRPAIETGWKPLDWPPLPDRTVGALARMMTSTPAAAEPRQVVTVPVTITPAELRRQARKLNRELVTATNRPVTIERLREEYGLSRRDAVALRREVVDGSRS